MRSDGGRERIRGGRAGEPRGVRAEGCQQGGARADGAGVPAVRVPGRHPAVRVLRVRVEVARAAAAQRHRRRRARRATGPAAAQPFQRYALLYW